MSRHKNAPCSVEPVLPFRATVRRQAAHRWTWVCGCGKPGKARGYGVWHVAYRAAFRHVVDVHMGGGDTGHIGKLQRYRCTVVGCNPELYGERAAELHRAGLGHRTAKWPVRSAEGQRRARQRNRSGYYDRYNVGAKSRGGFSGVGDDHPGSEDALGQA